MRRIITRIDQFIWRLRLKDWTKIKCLFGDHDWVNFYDPLFYQVSRRCLRCEAKQLYDRDWNVWRKLCKGKQKLAEHFKNRLND